MAVDLFKNLCSDLGYRSDTVLSVRVTASKVVVAFVDESGELRKAEHPPVPITKALDAPTPATGPR